jgi:uncharacterized integral membrane protein
MSALTIDAAVFVAPVILWIVYRIRLTNRRAVQAEREALPFVPKAEPAAAMLRGFPLPERTFLRQQFTTARIGYLVSSWFFTMIFTMPLLPLPAWKHITWTDPAAYAWFRYAESAASGIQLSLIFCSFAMLAAVLPLRQGPDAQFYRTRPLGRSFQFWARVLPVLGAVLAAALTGASVSFALLAAIKGPVWQHLPSSFPGIVTPDDDRPQLYAALVATSVPRVFLSLCTTVAMFFSGFAVLFTIPVNWWRSRNPTPLRFLASIVAGMLIAWTVVALDMLEILHLPRELFFYTHLGPPPPYIFMICPILITAGLLVAARFFTSRLEF